MTIPTVRVHSVPANMHIDSTDPSLRVRNFPLVANDLGYNGPSPQGVDPSSIGKLSGTVPVDIDYMPGMVDINVSRPMVFFEVVGGNVDLLIA